MKTKVIKALLYMQICAFIAVSSLGGPKGSPKGEPFHGSFQGDETYVLEGDDLFTSGDGDGNASHLGRFSGSYETVSEPFLPGNFGVTSYELIAANGDSLFIEAHGQGDGSQFPVVTAVEVGTITGGTGRFEGAGGTILIDRVSEVVSDTVGTSTFTFTGTIILSKAH